MTSNMNDTEPIRFTLKDLTCKEHFLEIGQGMTTIENLCLYVSMHYRGLPRHLQRFQCAFKKFNYHYHEHPNIDIEEMFADLPRFGWKPGNERIIWLMWMSDDDYRAISPHGGFILRSELQRKREHHDHVHRGQRPLEAITIRQWRRIHEQSIFEYEGRKRRAATQKGHAEPE